MSDDRDKNYGSGKSGRDQNSPQNSDNQAGDKRLKPTGKKINSKEIQQDKAGGSSSSNPKKTIPRSRFKIALLITGGVLVLMLVVAGTYATAFFSDVQEPQRVLLDEVTFEEEHDVDTAFSDQIVNIAMLGFDRGWNREAYGEYMFRPDMIAVFTINFETDQISVVRVPRDSYVPIYGTGGFYDKINHSFYFGYNRGGGADPDADGIEYTLKTVSNVLGGIPIHYYVSVDMYSVIALVDAVGGVYYEVEEEIIDTKWEVGRVLVPEGPQLMDGKTFLRYLQHRDNKTSQDYGRIDRQMSLLKESFYYLREKGRITDIPTTYRIYKDYVDTDLTYTQIAALAYYARDIEATDETMHFYTLQGGGQMKDGIWYQVLNENDRLQVISEVFGINAERWPPIVLKDSPEYLEEQERKRLEEEGESFLDLDIFRRRGFDNNDDAENNDPGMVMVPDVRGMTTLDAQRELGLHGLHVGKVTSQHYSFLDKGLVIYSEPLEGTLIRRGSIVNLVVSDGRE